MGILRFLLAISVIIAHTSLIAGFGLVGGQVAVETFFIISGFYISLILNEKYIGKNNSYWLFLSNRLLRILPVYWIILIITIICALLIPNYRQPNTGGLSAYWEYANKLAPSTWFYLGVVNLFAFFQDTILFLGVNLQSGDLFYTHSFALTNPKLYQFSVIPQAWSIGIELLFYVIAPFILRRGWPVIISLMSLSILFKIYGLLNGFSSDPWTYRFFPFELGYFLMGTLAYFIYSRYLKEINISLTVNLICLFLVITATVVYSKVHFEYVYECYIVTIFLMIPFVFKFTRDIKIDRFAGELSYPIYIIHILVRNLLLAAGMKFHVNILTILGSVILSILIIKLIGNRIEKARQRRVRPETGVQKNSDALSVKLNAF